MRRGDGVHVAGEVQVQPLHGHDLAVAAARGAALDAEGRPHRGLADRDGGALADLAKRDGWKGLLEGALEKLGTISLFVHAASPRRLEADTPLSVSEATWDAMTDINLRSGFFLAREVGRQMRENRIKGRILLITSQHREMPRNLPHYSASKAGMTMVMKELARGLAPDGIRVNAIAPGAIPGGGFVADNLGELVTKIPLGRAGTPDDIAQVAVAVLSERFGRYVVGTTVEVDGGLGLISWIPSKA